MRALLALALMTACGGGQQGAPSKTAASAGETETEGEAAIEPTTDPDEAVGPTWLRLVQSLRYDMRVGQPASKRGSTIEEVEAAFRQAGGTLDCSDLTWVSDEDGVSERQCSGELAVEGAEGMITVNFRRYEIPGEPTEPGLMNLFLGGPMLGAEDGAMDEWLAAVRARLEPVYGAPDNVDETDAADLRWSAADRHLLLHDASRAPCDGLCGAFLWVAGPEDPQLSARGF